MRLALTSLPSLAFTIAATILATLDDWSWWTMQALVWAGHLSLFPMMWTLMDRIDQSRRPPKARVIT